MDARSTASFHADGLTIGDHGNLHAALASRLVFSGHERKETGPLSRRPTGVCKASMAVCLNSNSTGASNEGDVSDGVEQVFRFISL